MRTGVALAPPVDEAPTLMLGGVHLVLDHAGGVLLSDQRMLVVADLHLEKAADFARHGQMLPPYDSRASLLALQAMVMRLKPARLVLLGDSFHRATSRLSGMDQTLLGEIATRCGLIWITGNHDAALPDDLPGEIAQSLRVGDLILRHEPTEDGCPEIIGHLHPAARIATRAGIKRRRCFLASSRRLLLPAIGSLTGSLDVHDAPIRALFAPAESRAYLLGKESLHAVPMAALVPQRSGFSLSGK